MSADGNVTPGWKQYQNETAEFFRQLGLDARTDVTLKGVRTSHDVDVVVRSHHVGFDVTWLIECKHWDTRVSKLHVLALREIVSDIGADRGIILAEHGFQSGAVEAAALTNVHISSLRELRDTASTEICAMRLREVYDRLESAREQYWNIPKDRRIEFGLRFEVGEFGYSGAQIIELVDDLLKKAFRGTFPIKSDEMRRIFAPTLPISFGTSEEVLTGIEPLIADLEARLVICIGAK